ncbi:AMIN-like domain-containing (lipo)protein [Nocardia thailandica]
MGRVLLLLLSVSLGALLSAAPAAADPGSCEVSWGSLDKSDATAGRAPLSDVRAGRHECFDRLVIEVAGPVTGYRAGYVGSVTMDGSGQAVPLRGGAFVQVTVHAPAHDDAGRATYLPADRAEAVPTGGYDTFRQVAWAGSFEGRTTFGIGVRARLPLRVSTLEGPGSGSRVVVDVAHRW